MTTTEPDMARAEKPQTAHELSTEAERIADEQPLIEPAELVDRAASTEIERAEVHAPLEAGPPGALPGQTDLLALAQLANTFAGAALVPKALQGRPADVLLVLLTARDLGLPATVALRECHPIDGRVTVSPKLKLAIVRERHLGRVWPDQENDVNAHTWYASRIDDPETIYRSTYTWEDAQRAGLVKKTCQPTEHARGGDKGCGCKSNWKMYPGQMLQWRSIGYLMDQAFGEVGTGLYGADELGAITDDEGRIIDVAEIGNLPGMEVPETPPPPPVERADPDATWDLQVRIRALPNEHRAKLAERWKDSTKLTYEASDHGGRYPLRPFLLPAASLATAESMVTGFERLAAREGWDAQAARAEVEVAVGTAICPYLVPLIVSQGPATAVSRGVEAPPGGSGDGGDPETSTGAHSAPPEVEPYDPKNPPSEILEAAIDRAKAIPDDELADELLAVDQDPVEDGAPGSSPDMRRRRLVLAWLVRQWRPEQEPF